MLPAFTVVDRRGRVRASGVGPLIAPWLRPAQKGGRGRTEELELCGAWREFLGMGQHPRWAVWDSWTSFSESAVLKHIMLITGCNQPTIPIGLKHSYVPVDSDTEDQLARKKKRKTPRKTTFFMLQEAGPAVPQ